MKICDIMLRVGFRKAKSTGRGGATAVT